MEPRQLLSADIELESALTGSGASFAEVEYKADSDRQSLKFKIVSAGSGTFSVFVGTTQIGQMTVISAANPEVEFRSDAKGGENPVLPSGLSFSKGTEIRLVPSNSPGLTQLTGQLAVKGEDPRFASCVRFDALTPAGQVVESEYEAEIEGTVTHRTFTLTARNLPPNSTQAVTIGGLATNINLSVNALGVGSLRYSDPLKPGDSSFPAGFPAITPGTSISIGSVVSGNYVMMLQTPSSAPVSGVEVKIPLRGTGALQGFITWETTASRQQFKVEVWGGKAGASVAVSIQRPGSAAVPLSPIVLNSKGYGRLQFDSADANKKFPASFPKLSTDTVFNVGPSLAAVFASVNPSLAPDDRSAREAYILDQTKDFTISGSLSENHGGKGEKWLKDKAGKWHFITPDGSLYEWDGKAGANGKRIAVLDDAYHAKPELLAQAKATIASTTDDSLLKATAARLDRELNLTPGSSTSTNWGGLSEKWVRGNGKWYFITPDGTLTLWDSTKPKVATGTVVARLDSRYHEDISRLTEAEKQLTAPEKAFAANTSLGINYYTSANDGIRGVDVKWVKSATDQWYFIRPSDELYLWDRRGFIAEKTGLNVSGTLISAITGAYANPTLLTTPAAKPPGTVASRAVLDDLFIDLPDFN
ncbi:MAG: hypothetical protein ACKO2P_10755 [Planctomycetota bacterium]